MIDIDPVRAFVQREFMYDHGADLPNDATLFPEVVDSLGVMELVDFVEQTYGVEVDEQELVVTNFSSLNAIASLIERKQSS